jgi:hypothetical protein
MAPFFIYVYQPLLMSNTLLGIILGALYLSFAWYAGWRRANPILTVLAAKRYGVWANSHVGFAWLGGSVLFLWPAV